MAIFKFKKEVPDELPDLAINQLKEELKQEEIKEKKEESIKNKESNSLVLNKETSESKKEESNKNNSNENLEKSFFNQLLNDINEEINTFENLEKWYEERFSSQDIVDSMKGFWKNQKSDLVLRSLGQNLKEKIKEKIKRLQALEAEWQNIYFNLIEKEEEMRNEEKELKKIISEFIEIGKKKINNEENNKEGKKE
ncbi:MAG: hypothetical protein QW273_01165 [Candidatus Pacearchaeota archaeon]